MPPKTYTTVEIIEHFGGPIPLAGLLDCSRQAIDMWRGLVPRNRAFEVMLLSRGKFNLDNMPISRPVNAAARQIIAEMMAA
jgi:hypothetical protein